MKQPRTTEVFQTLPQKFRYEKIMNESLLDSVSTFSFHLFMKKSV